MCNSELRTLLHFITRDRYTFRIDCIDVSKEIHFISITCNNAKDSLADDN